MSNEAKQKKVDVKSPHQLGQMRELFKQSKVETTKETQEILNRPLVTPEEISEEDEKFLKMVIGMIGSGEIGSGEIDLYKTSSLLNDPIYEQLSLEKKAEAEINALNLINTLRQISKLYESKATDTYQFKNILHQFRITKERLEDADGDIFII